MDTYFEPLVDEILMLWKGMHMKDISHPIGSRIFKFHAMLLFTMYDAPGLSMCYGEL